jgi:mannose-6-phosphate isomerase
LLPAALGALTIEGPADLLIGYLPDLDHDIREPLRDAGYSAAVIARLGDAAAGAGHAPTRS